MNNIIDNKIQNKMLFFAASSALLFQNKIYEDERFEQKIHTHTHTETPRVVVNLMPLSDISHMKSIRSYNNNTSGRERETKSNSNWLIKKPSSKSNGQWTVYKYNVCVCKLYNERAHLIAILILLPWHQKLYRWKITKNNVENRIPK